ncbi:calcium binding egf domain-containing protein [Toxoplasma gondii MAS]|uniref:Calcium binding egf domain-containing protein n=1 Tax=Toxoplasma gondii MAS TaxID=943118 RepID=A0A086R0C3_TOXGO|nr:calcium binding egf domain-containing protein [Toxoplasma gondii MAS]
MEALQFCRLYVGADIDECATDQNDCSTRTKNSVCRNTDGSYECICDIYRTLSANSCEDINECLENRGGCGNNSECVNQIGAPQLCKCYTGYEGNNDQPGTDCKDIDECLTMTCGAHSKCVNTPGSYICQCDSGYTESSAGHCEEIDYCGTGQNQCDTYYADCVQSNGVYTCKCKDFFRGTGTSGNCTPVSGYEYLACELLGSSCNSYQECQREALGSYSCKDKTSMQQLSTFFSEGGSVNTPAWIWFIVVFGGFLLILFLWFLTKKLTDTKRRNETQETTLYANYTPAVAAAPAYGAMDYYG